MVSMDTKTFFLTLYAGSMIKHKKKTPQDIFSIKANTKTPFFMTSQYYNYIQYILYSKKFIVRAWGRGSMRNFVILRHR